MSLPQDRARIAELEMRLSWIAAEVRAAGIAAVANGPTMSDRVSQVAGLTLVVEGD